MRRAVLLVSFGTSYKKAREESLDLILKEAKEVAGEIPVYQAYTSQVILSILNKENINIPSVKQAVLALMEDGVESLLVIPTHMIPGIEYEKLKGIILSYGEHFKEITFTNTILHTQKDCEACVDVLAKILEFSPEKEYILMGHGSEAAANIRYHEMNEAFWNMGYTNVQIASVEAKPDLEDAMKRLEGKEVSSVVLHPFMVVAGDHANNDMAGEEEDSYASVLKDAGYEVEVIVKGLGEYPLFRQIYLEHIKAL